MERASRPNLVWIYTDGACSGNPGPGGWAYLARHKDDVWAASGCEKSSTNNRMELQATYEALRSVRARNLATEPLVIFTDSSYVLKGIQEWMPAWVKRGWKKVDGTDVMNRDMWELLSHEVRGLKLEWALVPGHSGVAGNEFVDEWSVEASKQLKGAKKSWALESFEARAAFEVWPTERVSKPKSASGSKSSSSRNSSSSSSGGGKAFYVSLIKGELIRHSTWPECEARVKGTSGARYKKIKSESELSDVLKSWGHKAN
ncbi:MAG: viroplasmin family protein [Bdellovibrionota bacterium]